MKMKTLATALTLSMPLIFGGAYAQTTTAPDAGNNRSGDGGAMTTNPTPEPGTGVGTDGNTGTTGTGTSGTGTTTAPGASGPLDSAATPDAAAPGMETQPDSAATTEAITGWSAKDDLMGKSVFNENDEKIGDVNDVVIASDGRTMYLLVGAGGFLGMGAKNVAVPFDRFERQDDRILLSGYSKEQLKALPEVQTQR